MFHQFYDEAGIPSLCWLSSFLGQIYFLDLKIGGITPFAPYVREMSNSSNQI